MYMPVFHLKHFVLCVHVLFENLFCQVINQLSSALFDVHVHVLFLDLAELVRYSTVHRVCVYKPVTKRSLTPFHTVDNMLPYNPTNHSFNNDYFHTKHNVLYVHVHHTNSHIANAIQTRDNEAASFDGITCRCGTLSEAL